LEPKEKSFILSKKNLNGQIFKKSLIKIESRNFAGEIIKEKIINWKYKESFELLQIGKKNEQIFLFLNCDQRLSVIFWNENENKNKPKKRSIPFVTECKFLRFDGDEVFMMPKRNIRWFVSADLNTFELKAYHFYFKPRKRSFVPNEGKHFNKMKDFVVSNEKINGFKPNQGEKVLGIISNL